MYHIGIYLRISKEDGVREESQSILGQRNLLKEFAQKEFINQEIQTIEFLDDGYTGTNDRRPALRQLLTLVKEKKINCILVKDFSRLARDYLLLGEYMEVLFPMYQVRFISVNDKYDSEKYQERMMGLDTHFRGLCYDLYSKDISCKVKSALKAKKKAGVYVSANTPFGYEKSPSNPHEIQIKEDEAKVVRTIFQLAAEGYGATEIARKLEGMQVKTPKDFRSKNEKKKTSHWYAATVWRILRNPVYIGELIQGKYEKEYIGGRNRKTKSSQWMIQKEHHEKIVSKELFEKIMLAINSSK